MKWIHTASFIFGAIIGYMLARQCQKPALIQEAKIQPTQSRAATNGEGVRSKEIPFAGSLQAAQLKTESEAR